MTDEEFEDLRRRAEQAALMLFDGITGNPHVIYEMIVELRQIRKEYYCLANLIAESARRNGWHVNTYNAEYWLNAAKEATCQKN